MHFITRARCRLAVIAPVALAALGGVSVASAADRPWIEIASEHFTVATDSNEKTARTIAWQFEQVRAAILIVCPWAKANLDRPVLVFAARDENSMKALAPKYWEQRGSSKPNAVAAGGSDRFYVALRADELAENVEGVNPYMDAYWTYASIAIDGGMRRELPMWFDRGLADLLSNIIVRSNDIEVGRVIPSDILHLRSGEQRLQIKDLLRVDRKSPWGTYGGPQFSMFDSESWAFVHFLIFADKGAYNAQFQQFAALMLKGAPIDAATEQVFKNVDALQQAFSTYITRDVYELSRIKLDTNVNRDKFVARSWSPAEAKGKQALFLAATDRSKEALALVADARKLDPKLPDTYEVEALLFEEEKKPAEARAAFEKAVELGSTSFYPYYRFATMARAGADAATLIRVEAALDRAAALNPHHVFVNQWLGDVKVQVGHAEQAIAPLQRAVALDPRSAPLHLSLARAYFGAGKKEDAQREAREAVGLSTTDVERARAQQFLAQYSR